MGLFAKLFKNAPKPSGDYGGMFKLLNWYTPQFTTFGGGIYESEMIREAINAIATNVSKLRVEVKGSARRDLQNKLKHGPNQFQTWSQFMYRLSTILCVHNTAFITPVFDEYGDMTGIYAPLPSKCEIVDYGGTPYLRYQFSWGEWAAIELASCGVMTRYQYHHDFFGEKNTALVPTIDLIGIQNQGIKEGVKNAASYRFMARINNFAKTEDLKNERKRFTEMNLKNEEDNGGLLLFPNNYTDIRQVDSKPWVVDADQMKVINDNVYKYFGVNEDVIMNKAFGDAWAAFYEGAIEPFAIQFSEVVTKMLFTFREQSQGNLIMATANRLQYMSNADKLQVSAQMLDRGVMSINEIREIWNLAPVEDGDTRIIRGEYYSASEKVQDDGGDKDGE